MTYKKDTVLIASLIILLGMFFLYTQKKNLVQKISPKTEAKIPVYQKEMTTVLAGGSSKMEIRALPRLDRYIYNLGDTVEILLSGSSSSTSIAGLDVLMTYDTSVLSYQSYNPTLDSFDFFVNKTPEGVVLSAIKKLDDKKNSPFADTSIAVLEFKAIKKGDAHISLIAKEGSKKETNLLDKSGRDLLGAVLSPSILVGEMVTVSSAGLKNGDLGLRLVKTTLAPKNCFDCISSATISVSTGKETKEILYESGGLVGNIPQPQQVGRYIIELSQLRDKEVILHVFSYLQ
ncbi:MAG: hypothetical protein ACMG6E_02020 [Candidatus Roizmanbacteria bacterium]